MSKFFEFNIINIHNSKSLILTIFVLIIKVIIIQSFSIFKTIPVINNKYYMVTSKGIIFFNNNLNTYNLKHTFNEEQRITTEEEKQMIYYGRFENSEINLLINKKLYLCCI